MESTNSVKSAWKAEWPLLVVLAAPFVSFAVTLSSLPSQVPMHFDAHGTINRYGSPWELLILPFINVGVAAVLYFIPRLDPKQQNIHASSPAYRWIRFAIAAFFTYIFFLTQASSFNPRFDVGPLIAIGVLVLFFALGFAMPKLKQNYMIGIRLPWTLESEENWNRTHAFSGKLWTWGSLLGIVLVFLFPSVGLFLALGTVIALAIGTSVYSYRLFRQQQGRHFR
ncbi:MAG TPA: SdpI family protein [Candidatus Kapabacteria bacterium]|jgi:uncharacterized membrane protein